MTDARDALKISGRVKKSRARVRRPTSDELDRLCTHFDARSALPMRDIIHFAVATAMRAGEITRLRWADLDETKGTITIRDRKDPKDKIGNHQVVPVLAGDTPETLAARVLVCEHQIYPRAVRWFVEDRLVLGDDGVVHHTLNEPQWLFHTL